MSQYSVKHAGSGVFGDKVMVDGELVLSRLKVVRLDTVKVLEVGLMVSNIVDFRVKNGRALVLMHRRSDPGELINDVLVGAEDLL